MKLSGRFIPVSIIAHSPPPQSISHELMMVGFIGSGRNISKIPGRTCLNAICEGLSPAAVSHELPHCPPWLKCGPSHRSRLFPAMNFQPQGSDWIAATDYSCPRPNSSLVQLILHRESQPHTHLPSDNLVVLHHRAGVGDVRGMDARN